MNKSIPKAHLIILVFLSIVMVAILPFSIKNLKQITGEEYSDCGYSKYNTYSNSTEAYESFFGTKCYIPVYSYYETNKQCGFLGISCYESSESTTKSYRSEVCFYKKTGELC